MRKIILTDATEFYVIKAVEDPIIGTNKRGFTITFQDYSFDSIKSAFTSPSSINSIKLINEEGELVRVINNYSLYDIQLKLSNEKEQILVNLVESDSLQHQINTLTTKVSRLESDLPIEEDMDMMSASELKTYKKSVLQAECKKSIYEGIIIKTSIGSQHFSYTAEDQRNLESLFNIAILTGLDIPYHADGESCTLYPSSDIIHIYTSLQNHKLYHTTYINALNRYIEDLSDLDVIKSVSYGKTTLPKKYLDEMNSVLENGQTVIQQVKRSIK
ncbi:hypothetical protein [Murimonas intestini]|uniref:Uncharacterized protein n=1 Tax=Murimonas intestini TaxID=1337051 RepID=A0AB73T1Q2_9FIRM|nr:hypothetical protein [Murimonas intestini]MCR1842510.1 hypothetical protein [Murimonas intestini]MCR1867132.1 hypothetical protein [Murimonas intestini]MCR1884318.1 hypothetical protein [Murimonas intestini]